MAVITKKQREAFYDAFNNMEAMLPSAERIEMSDLISLYWTNEFYEKVREIELMVAPSSVTSSFKEAIRPLAMFIPDDMPWADEDRGVTLEFVLSANYKGLVPDFSRGFRDDAPTDKVEMMGNAVNSILRMAHIKGMMQNIRSVYEKCSTHEAFRYIFPTYQYVLRRAGYSDIAGSIETIKRIPTTTYLMTTYQRQVMKYMNEWFATQIILGTFDPSNGVNHPMPLAKLSLARDVVIYNREELTGEYTRLIS